MVYPIEVSRGRVVDLSGEPQSELEVMKKRVRPIIRQFKFKRAELNAELRISEAILQCKDYRAHPYHSYAGKKVTRQSFGTARPAGRKDQELLRFYLIGILWSSWCEGQGKQPQVNNKGDDALPFVRFVQQIFLLMGFGKVIDHLERYQSYRKASLAGLSYQQWQAVH
jgi:hypothetical protein